MGTKAPLSTTDTQPATIDLETSSQTTATSDQPPGVLYSGFDSFGASPRTTAVSGGSTTGPANGIGRYRSTVCLSESDVYNAISVSSQASASFGVASADAKSDYVKTLKLTTTSVTVVVYAWYGETDRVTGKYKLDVDPPTTTAGLLDFYNIHGDGWVDSIMTGGEFWATWTFYSSTSSEQMQVKASLEANATWGKGSADASIDTAIEKAQTLITTKVDLQEMIRGVQADLPAPDELLTFARSFPAMVGKSTEPGVIIGFSTQGYDNVQSSSPKAFQPLAKSRRLFYNSDPGVTTLSSAMSKFATLEAQIRCIQGTYDAIGYTGDAMLSKVTGELPADESAYGKLLAKLQQDPTVDPGELPPAPSLAPGLPQLASYNQGPRVGGSNGLPIYFGAPIGTILAGIEVNVADSGMITAMTWGFSDPAAFGTITWAPAWYGKPLTENTQQLLLNKNEIVTQMEVQATLDGYVHSISITTSDGRNVAWGSALGAPAPVSWSFSATAPLCGFYGFAGVYIDSLGPLTVVPATWTPWPE